MTPLKNLVSSAIKNQEGRVFPLQWQGQRIWIKRTIPAKTKFFHRLQHLGSGLLGWYIPLLKPTVCTGGPEALRAEALRLARFKKAGISVPEILDMDQHWLALSDAGVPLSTLLSATETHNKDALILRGVHAVVAVHRAGLCLGSGRLRDLLFDGKHISCIDGEEDPSLFMPLAAAQARDIVLFLLSTLRHYSTDFSKIHRVFQEFVTLEPSPVLREVAKLQRLLFLMAPLRLVPQGWLGRDLREGVLLAQLLRNVQAKPRNS